MKRAMTLTGLLVVGLVPTILSGCEEGSIRYEGKLQKISIVEEIISDKLEVENPDLDLEVNVMEAQED